LYLELKIPATDFRFSKIISQVRQLKPAGYKILLQDLPINSKAKIYLSEAAGNDTGVQSAISTAFNGLQMFLTNKIAHLTDTSTFDLNDLIFKPTILYVQFGEYKEIATLLMTLAYKYLNNYLSNNKLLSFSERPIHYIIDEFGNLPKMDFVSKIFSLDRAKNIFAMITLQSKSQLLALYGKERTQELIDSAQAIVVCSLADYELATDLSNKSGQGLREVVSVQKGKDTKTDTFAKNAFKNIQPEDFIMKKDDEMIVVFQGLKAYKFNYIPY
jgi:type IV secretion system protein VirD4